MPEHNVDQVSALLTDFPATPAPLMLQANAVILDLQEFLVEREEFRGVQLPLGTELLLGMGKNFFAVSGHGKIYRVAFREGSATKTPQRRANTTAPPSRGFAAIISS
jgi:hypothetical protein